MGWGFQSHCPDCNHHWEGVDTNLRIGQWNWYGPSLQNSHCLFCPRCYRRLYYPSMIDRAAWHKWYSSAIVTGIPDWLAPILVRIDESFPKDNWYSPQVIQLDNVCCPICILNMVSSSEEHDRLICPNCGSNRPILSEYDSHVNLWVSDEGFA